MQAAGGAAANSRPAGVRTLDDGRHRWDTEEPVIARRPLAGQGMRPTRSRLRGSDRASASPRPFRTVLLLVASLALLAALVPACDFGFDVYVPSPTTRHIYAGPLSPIVPVHVHGVGCGHTALWYDGHETFLEGDVWVFYSSSRGSWMRYDDPPRKLVKAAKRSHRTFG